MSSRILVVGAGAVGCFYASKLDESSAHIGMVCRSNYTAIKEHGISLRTHSFGDYHFNPHAVYDCVESAAHDGPWDMVLVATKVLDTSEKAGQLIAAVVGETTCIVLIQNGVLIEEPFRARFPTTPIISAVTLVSATLVEPNVAVQHRWTRICLGPYSEIGAHDDSEEARALLARATEAMHTLANLWTRGGIRDVEECDARMLQFVRWHKISINASFNVTGVLCGCLGNGEMVRDPLLRAHVKACMNEVLDATEKVLGAPLPSQFASPEKLLTSNERNVGSKPSMVQDWEAGRPLELDAILRNTLILAQRHDVQMPRLESMYALLASADRVRLA